MSASGAAKLKGFLVGPTELAVLEREVLSYPPEEQAERMKALLRRERLQAEEEARLRVESLLRDPR
jgi:hypothetical protein